MVDHSRRTQVIAYHLNALPRLNDDAVRQTLAAREHRSLISLMQEGDTRRKTFCPNLEVPAIMVTEQVKERVQTAFAAAGIPVLFTWI